MTYSETLDYLYHSTPVFEHVGASAYKPGLETTLSLAAHWGNPHERFQSVHVAGTNGKGSVAHSIAAILQTAGYKVGLYTSPHLVDFRERIRINGEPVSESFVTGFVKEFIQWNASLADKLSPSFFELTTIMAFSYFAQEQVDVAVVEVGLGGRLDSTNIITPILSVITNISYDHQQLLGDTLTQIASEKAGIIKPCVPVVIGERTSETAEVFTNKASELSAPLFFADEFTPDSEYEFELKGAYQERNLRTILCAINNVPLHIDDKEKVIREALTNVCGLTGLKGRWQTLQEKPRVVCDTGHNVAAWEYLSRQIAEQECDTLRIVFGMVDDKDISSVMELLPQNAEYYFTQATTHRALPSETILKIGREHHLRGRKFNTVSEAYTQALADSTGKDFIFIGGSSYIVADLLTFLA